MKLILALIWLVPLLDVFDRLYDRYAERLRPWDRSERWITFGYLLGHGFDGEQDDVRKFWHLKLPSYEWAPIDCGRTWGWCQRVVYWVEGKGLKTDLWGLRE